MASAKQPEHSYDGGVDDELEDEAIFAEINITPLTDIFLVMLIIFIVAAAAVLDQEREETRQTQKTVEREKRSGLEVNLPSGAALEIDPAAVSLVVSIAVNGDLEVNQQRIKEGDLDRVFVSYFAKDKNTQLILRADTGVPHGRVVGVMERAKLAGLSRIAIATSGAQ